MQTITIRSQKNVEQLIEEYYGKLPAAQLDAIKAATLAVNPGLNGSAILQPGMSIVIPSLSAVSIPGNTKEAINAALSDYQGRLEQTMEFLQEELKATKDVLASSSFQETIKHVPISSHAQEFLKNVENKINAGWKLDEVKALIKEVGKLKEKFNTLPGTLS